MKYLEVQFKGNRRVTFTNPSLFPVKLGDLVVVVAEKGEDLGRVVQITDVDRITDEEERHNVSSILRKAGPHDFQRQRRNQQKEERAEEVCRRMIQTHHLPMKLINVEYQLDGRKVTFFFTAEGRVDFRDLVKDLAGELRTRIDLRQIGARDEARKFGGFGPCGQRQCCSGWLSRFDPVTTSMAKEQNLPLNPTKLSGNCGRLKCCLRYELEFYREELSQYPPVDKLLKTIKGAARIDKVDIFAGEVLIRYQTGEIETLSHEQLAYIMDLENAPVCTAAEMPQPGAGREDMPPRYARPSRDTEPADSETESQGVTQEEDSPSEEAPRERSESRRSSSEDRRHRERRTRSETNPDERRREERRDTARRSDIPERRADADNADGDDAQKKRRRGRRGGRRNRARREGEAPAQDE